MLTTQWSRDRFGHSSSHRPEASWSVGWVYKHLVCSCPTRTIHGLAPRAEGRRIGGAVRRFGSCLDYRRYYMRRTGGVHVVVNEWMHACRAGGQQAGLPLGMYMGGPARVRVSVRETCVRS